MKKLAAGLATLTAIVATFAACSSSPDEKVGQTAQPFDEIDVTDGYVCPKLCGCKVDPDTEQCLCRAPIPADGTCGHGYFGRNNNTQGIPVWYVWNPCPSGQSLHCNVFGSCWCS